MPLLINVVSPACPASPDSAHLRHAISFIVLYLDGWAASENSLFILQQSQPGLQLSSSLRLSSHAMSPGARALKNAASCLAICRHQPAMNFASFSILADFTSRSAQLHLQQGSLLSGSGPPPLLSDVLNAGKQAYMSCNHSLFCLSSRAF